MQKSEKMWQSDDINCKWAPMLLYGPQVEKKNALEFIRRTDHTLMYPGYSCNDREFNKELVKLIGDPTERLNHEAYEKAFGCLRLENLGSHWVASRYIGGPNGPVAPDGTVFLSKNFGKYPSVDQIENELHDISNIFPWLQFNLYVWDDPYEKAVRDPDFGWFLESGAWGRTNDRPVASRSYENTEVHLANLLMSAQQRETTWSVDEIKEMWGDRIKVAREAAEKKISETSGG